MTSSKNPRLEVSITKKYMANKSCIRPKDNCILLRPCPKLLRTGPESYYFPQVQQGCHCRKHLCSQIPVPYALQPRHSAEEQCQRQKKDHLSPGGNHHAEAVLMFTPFCSAGAVKGWRRSWKRIVGSPARSSTRWSNALR